MTDYGQSMTFYNVERPIEGFCLQGYKLGCFALQCIQMLFSHFLKAGIKRVITGGGEG